MWPTTALPRKINEPSVTGRRHCGRCNANVATTAVARLAPATSNWNGVGRNPVSAAIRCGPGGRATRVRNAIATAVDELLREDDWSRITLARVAERAGVHPSTVYRRWESLPELVNATVDERLQAMSPLPDTGTLAGDVRAHAAGIAADLAGRDGTILIRAATITGALGHEPQAAGRDHPLASRTTALAAMFERAANRGEPTGDAHLYFEYVIGPLYAYALLVPGLLKIRAPVLADRYLKAVGQHG